MTNIFNLLLARQSHAMITIICLMLILLLGGVDYVTGRELSFSIFYTGPIVIATWYAGRNLGIVCALIASLVWYVADVADGMYYSHTLIPIWNSLMRLCFFLIILSLIDLIKRRLEIEASLAVTDHLTRLPNRRAFDERLAYESERARRYAYPLTIAYIDLDNFKFINDTLGHDVGDELLRVVSETLRGNIRGSDIASRLGGDEFACLYPVAHHPDIKVILEKLHGRLTQAMQAHHWPVTFSIGAVTFENSLDEPHKMLRIVDELMYQVKKSGKNSVLFEQR